MINGNGVHLPDTTYGGNTINWNCSSDSDDSLQRLKAENAKLRELVRNLWPFVKAGLVSACPNRGCCLFEECDADSEYECPIEEHMAGRMRELGVVGD